MMDLPLWAVPLMLMISTPIISYAAYLQCSQARDYLVNNSTQKVPTPPPWLNRKLALTLGGLSVWMPWIAMVGSHGLGAFNFSTLLFISPTIIILPPVLLATFIDGLIHRLPNVLLFNAAVSWVIVVLALLVLYKSDQFFLRSIYCAAVALILFVLAALAGMGMGDVKLATILAAWLGWYSVRAVIWALFIAIVGAGLWALWGLFRGKICVKSALAFGPWLTMGGIFAWAITIVELPIPLWN